MPDALDDQTLAEIRAVVGAVNANTLVLPGRHGGPLEQAGLQLIFRPGELFCYDVSWIERESIHGSCWYDPHGFDWEAVSPGDWNLDRFPVMVRRRAHFPDYVVWKVDHAPRKRNAQNRMFRTPTATLPICPDTLESPISDGVKSRKEPTSE